VDTVELRAMIIYTVGLLWGAVVVLVTVFAPKARTRHPNGNETSWAITSIEMSLMHLGGWALMLYCLEKVAETAQ